jgi:hypothetical protein
MGSFAPAANGGGRQGSQASPSKKIEAPGARPTQQDAIQSSKAFSQTLVLSCVKIN